MGLLIKGMKMPKACYECSMYEADLYYCKVVERDIDIRSLDEKRCSFCPLIEIPPHGRLIDADTIPYKKIMLDEDDGEFYYGVTQPYIDRMPTIIEAEEGE